MSSMENGLKNVIQAAIVNELGDPVELISAVVENALKTKVDRHGHVTNNSYDAKTTLIEHMSRQAITDAAARAIREWCMSNQDAIKEAIKVELSKEDTVAGLAGTVVKSLIEGSEREYLFTLNIEAKSPDKEEY